MPPSLEEASKYLTPGLAAADLKEMYEELKHLRDGIRYFASGDFDYRLQGDAVQRAPYIVIGSEVSVTTTRVMLLSNTCDIAPENRRNEGLAITVAPIIRVGRWKETLERLGVATESIQSKMIAVKAQEVTNKFYLPAGQGLDEDCLVALDQIQSIPAGRFEASAPERLAVLSQAAHWLLCVKLSIHFCRLQEGVVRRAA